MVERPVARHATFFPGCHTDPPCHVRRVWMRSTPASLPPRRMQTSPDITLESLRIMVAVGACAFEDGRDRGREERPRANHRRNKRLRGGNTRRKTKRKEKNKTQHETCSTPNEHWNERNASPVAQSAGWTHPGSKDSGVGRKSRTGPSSVDVRSDRRTAEAHQTNHRTRARNRKASGAPQFHRHIGRTWRETCRYTPLARGPVEKSHASTKQ